MNRLVFGLLIAFATACSVAALERADKPAFKGMELYSWKPAGQDWHFSLLVGTNRLKSEEEIKKPEQTVVGVAVLKQRLAQLAEGETVVWRNLAAAPVPEVLAKELQTFCASLKIKLERIGPQGPPAKLKPVQPT